MHALERFADPSDVHANQALTRVCAIWRACAPLMLTDYIGALSLAKRKQLRSALAVALDIEDDPDDDIFEPT